MGQSRDLLTPEQRSRNMSNIRGKNTKPELLVRKLLHAKGYRYRLHGQAGSTKLPGRPDLVFAGRRKVIFINGCFWHFHDCRVGQHAPAANAEFWEAKRSRTRQRDALQREQLATDGWEVLTVWECELKDRSVLEERLTRFLGRRQSLEDVSSPKPAGRRQRPEGAEVTDGAELTD
ncbi:DNA mismatch endonuclease (patch repair protein) [Paenarthrobacter nicotinovorans]|uniref:very short patch repair endonuclease n=1 Tax=Micrococcaceae TaxID=1268 RepID=UPI0008769F2C|nr:MULTISPECIES: very short patch repair endonuclease [Micrococcaceae]MDR6436964.1 DNA mismatch endonuclease (patch repair protein) [Paenarthrobacter nicotinovorans]SCZ55077.1 T/G mismatch-specific endonuclease [Arthrobacter sp. UNCCL28]